MVDLFANGLFYGGDYNPEQWDESVWQEDVSLMKRAGVNLVTLGVFSWANLETAEGVYNFDWLDKIIELLHANDIGVDLATATASPPAWLVHKYPEVLPVTQTGVRLAHGGRQAYCPSSPVYRRLAVSLTQKLVNRYANHPAIKMWHVNNEYGCHNPMCFCEVSENAWQNWLRSKYQNLDSLNRAWGTDFWSQRYHEWVEIKPPRETPAGTYPNPGMMLDYFRFSNEQILELYKAERDTIRASGSVAPITTNFMSMKHSKFIDYWMWSKEVDFVSTDHYLIANDPENHIDLAFQADLTRGFASGKPWLLMEHSTSAVNWQDANLAKVDGQMLKNSISHVARGSNGAMFFQWRASQSGSEKFHSAMVSHAGTNTRIWRNVMQLGADLKNLASLSGKSTRKAKVAMVFDYESFWALSQKNLPTTAIDYPAIAHDWYKSLFKLGARVDFISVNASAEQLAEYQLVLMPMTYLLSDQAEQNFIDYAKNNGSLIVSYFAGIADLTDTIKLGGYGGKLVRETLGVFVEEFAPVEFGEQFGLENELVGRDWQQWATATGAESAANFAEGPAAGSLALAKHWVGVKPSWYLGTRLTDQSNNAFFGSVLNELGIEREGGSGVEVVYRGDIRFEINHNTNQVNFK